MCFLKKLSISLLFFVLFSSLNSAKSYDFSNNVYGKTTLKLGFTTQTYTGDVKRILNNANGENLHKSNATFGILLNGGYDFYYKITKSVNLFAGLNLEFRYNAVKIIMEENKKINDLMSLFSRFGSKFIINEKLAISPYALIGFNVMKAKIYEDKKTSVGLNVGGGIDFIINDYFIIGAEYSYSKNKNKTFTIDGHRISLKFGAQFF